MGIKDLLPTLKKINPSIVKEMPIEQFKNKRVAVDISIYINTFAMSSQEFWFNLITNFLLNLVRWKLNPIIIFDGKNVPPEKLDERESRKSSQQLNIVREEKLTHFRDKILMTCFDGDHPKIVPEEIQDELKKICRISKKDDLNLRDAEDVLMFVTNKLGKAQQAAEGITPRHKQLTRDLVKALGLPHIQADGEAETLATSMCVQGLVDAVISRDTDCLAYGCPMLINDVEKGILSYVCINDVLETLEFTMKQFVDMCICLGCDYNHRMKGNGPAAILKAIRQYGNIDGWKDEKSNLPFHTLKYKRCRILFRPYSKKYLDRCNIVSFPIDEVRLNELFAEVNSRYTSEYVINCLQGKDKPIFLGRESNILGEMN